MSAVHWCISGNVGDAYVPWLVRHLTGLLPDWGRPEDSGFVLGGSMLNHCAPGAIAWGCGVAALKDEVSPRADIRAVRGPLSRAVAQASGAHCPPIYGDAAMLAPRLYSPDPSPSRFKLGIVPHYVDQIRVGAWAREHARALALNGVRVISVFEPVERFIDAVCACDMVLSSSLHGLVFAHAYGVPAGWIQLGDSIGGDGTKYRDHLLALGVEPYDPLDLREGIPEPRELFRFHPPQPGSFSDAELFAALPPELTA